MARWLEFSIELSMDIDKSIDGHTKIKCPDIKFPQKAGGWGE